MILSLHINFLYLIGLMAESTSRFQLQLQHRCWHEGPLSPLIHGEIDSGLITRIRLVANLNAAGGLLDEALDSNFGAGIHSLKA